jgi:glutaconate CoA-transferase subunit B
VQPTIDELRAVFLSRDIADGEIGSCGLAASVPFSAMRLAQLRHAPDLTLAMEGALNPRPRHLFDVPVDPEGHRDGEAIVDLYDLFVASESGLDFWFMAGIQIDRHGNLNVHRVGGTPEAPAFRGPGIGNASAAMRAGRWYAYPGAHTPRTFVERVDFITTTGACCRYVVSPLAVLDFDDEHAMRVRHTMPGVTVQQVQDATGFDVLVHPDVCPIPEPDHEELRILREVIDPRGVLRRERG